MSDDSDSDDDVLNFNISSTVLVSHLSASTAGKKRERKQVARLGEELRKDNDEFDLEAMMRASDKNNRKIKKVGHNSSAVAIDQVLKTTIDWNFIEVPSNSETARARGRGGGGGEHSADHDADAGKKCGTYQYLYRDSYGGGGGGGGGDDDDDDDDDDGEEVEEMGDLDGKIRNIHRGARSLLCRQSILWPPTHSLAFDLRHAKDGSDTTALHAMFVKLAMLSSDPAGNAQALAEILNRPTNGIAEMLVTATNISKRKDAPIAAGNADLDSPTIAPCCVPRELWNWLMDLTAFHPMDAVVAAASFTLKSILERLPEPLDLNAQAPTKSWEPLRPLTYACVCRPLTCLGLDPMADDPTAATSEASSASARPGTRSSIGLQSRMDFEAVVRPMFPGCNLGALLDVWACCIESGHHSLCGDEKLDLLSVCCVIGADALALAVPRLAYHRNRLAAALLRGLPSPVIWPREAMRRITALVCVAHDSDLKVLIVRSIPVTRTGSRGKLLASVAVGYYAHQTFMSAADAGYCSLNLSSMISSLSDAQELAARLLEKFNSENCIRDHVNAKQIPRLQSLLATIDLLLIVGSSRHEFSVAALNSKMDEVSIGKCSMPAVLWCFCHSSPRNGHISFCYRAQFLGAIDRVVKVSVGGDAQELKEFAALLKCKYKPLVKDLRPKQKPPPVN